MTTTELRHWLTTRLAQELSVDEDVIDPDTPLAAYGLDSAAAVELTGDLARVLAAEVGANTLFEYPTVERLVTHAAEMGWTTHA